MSEDTVRDPEDSGTMRDYLENLEEPTVEELQAIEDEYGWLDFLESILEGSEVA